MVRAALLLLGVTLFCGCARKQTTPTIPTAPSDNSYLDLTAGSRLRILVPLWKPGQTKALVPEQAAGNTITLSAANLLGYEVSYYLAQPRREGKVHLQFASAEISKDGQTSPRPTPPELPFRLPDKSRFLRLVFLVRVSAADHNMAILAAKTRSDLDAFTTQLKRNPQTCRITRTISCIPVPEEISVRPETPGEIKR